MYLASLIICVNEQASYAWNLLKLETIPSTSKHHAQSVHRHTCMHTLRTAVDESALLFWSFPTFV